MSNIIECSECEYSEQCPCMWSLHNAACLTIQKPKKSLPIKMALVLTMAKEKLCVVEV